MNFNVQTHNNLQLEGNIITMNFKNKLFSYLLASVLMLALFAVSSFAADDELSVYEKLSDSQSGLMSIAYRGDTSEYPENSLEAIASALELGADMVSVSVSKTADGVLVLCEDDTLNHLFDTDLVEISETDFEQMQNLYFLDTNASATKYQVATLEQALEIIGDKILILDNSWEYKDEIYELLIEMDKLENAIIRTYENDDEIIEWTATLEQDIKVIGVYDSFVVFTMISHLNNLTQAGQLAVGYESANYYSMMYTSIFTNTYFTKQTNARAIASAYDYSKSGQRPDSTRGWDELISLGYSIIETNNIEQFTQYIEQTEEVGDEIETLLQSAIQIDTSLYSEVSVSNLESAISQAQTITANSCLDEKQDVRSLLISSTNSLIYTTKEDTQQGSLNITAGKIIAVVIMGAIIVCVQVYVHKRQDKKVKSN